MADDGIRERWRRLEEILVASWELPVAKRETYWLHSAGGDAALLAELRELSAARDAAGNWTPDPEPQPDDSARPVVGPYVLDRLIGRGGMGSVYLAHRADGEFEQQVAVKLTGLPLEMEAVRERFRRERQIVAGLNHPNIAHLVDGGTTDTGELFLVMEYVDGVSIDHYARSLDLNSRLRLFGEVCAGVQYAHQHLVVHRDIKPSNILVTSAGVPKLLDFGAAKLLEEAEPEPSRVGLITAAYASPEQLRGEPASTASDVFALGALLFEIAAGVPAFGGDLASRAVDPSGDPSFPHLPAALPGDLDRVVRKALAFEPAGRYASVEQFSEDIRRYQAGKPVAAHPPAFRYRARKFLSRHVWAVSFAAVFVAGMAGMIAYSATKARTAGREAERARAANSFLLELFELPFSDAAARHNMTVRELVELAEKRVTPSLGRDPAVASDVDLILGAGLMGEDLGEARTLFERSLDRARAAGDRARQALATGQLAVVFYQGNDIDTARKRSLEALGLWKAEPGAFTPDQAVRTLTTAAQTLQFIRPADPVHLPYLERAVELVRRYPGSVTPALHSRAVQALGESYLNDPGLNVDGYRKAYPLIEEAIGIDRSDPTLAAELIESLRSWGRVNRFLGHFDVDEAAQWEVYQRLEQMAGPDNPVTAVQRGIWAFSLAGVGKVQEAYRESQAGLATVRRAYRVRGSFQLWTNTAAAAYGACLVGQYKECEALAGEASMTLGPAPSTDDRRRHEARAYFGWALSGEGRYAEARPVLEEEVAYYRSRNRQGTFRIALDEAYTKAVNGR